MALVNQELFLEITPGAIPPILNVTEYDENMQVIIHLRQRGQAYEIPSGTTAKVEGTLAGHPFRVAATPASGEDTVTFELSEAMTGYAGRAWTKIKLIKDNKPVHTCGFWLDCDRAGVQAGDVIAMTGFEQQLKDGVYDYLDDHHLASIAFLPHDLLASGSLNDCTAPGYWLLTAANTYTDCPLPPGHAGLLCVYPPVNTVITQAIQDITSEFSLAWQRSSRSGSYTGRTWVSLNPRAKRKKYVAFGDSLTWGSVWSPTPGGSLHQVKEVWRIPTRIALAAGMEGNFSNEGVGNIGFFAAVNGETIISKIQGYNFTDVGLVTIMGGTNDRGSIPLGTADDAETAQTICGAIRKCIHLITAANPDTQIVIIQPPARGIAENTGDVWNGADIGQKWSLAQVDAEVSKLCRAEHVGYVNWLESEVCRNWNYVGYHNSTTPNYAHPTNDEAYMLLGDFIGGKIASCISDDHPEEYPEELYEKFVPEIVNGKYIHKDDGGERSGSEVAAVTTYLYVRPGAKIHIENLMCQLNASVCAYTIQHNFIAAMVHDTTAASATFTLPENAACIRITSPIGIRPTVYVERERAEGVIFAQDRIELGDLQENAFISKIDGSVRTGTTTYSCTDFVAIDPGYYQIITPMLRYQAGVCLYDAQKNFLRCALSDNIEYGQFNAADDVAYVRCSVLSAYSYAFWLEKIPQSAYSNETSYSDGWASATGGRVSSPFSRISSMEPTITIIDDDTTNVEYVERYHAICEEMGVKGNYAVITSRLEAVTGLKELLLQYEDQGYGMLYHCYSQTGATYFQPGANRDLALAEANYCKGVRQMREFGFTNYNYWISPYGVNDEDMQDLCKRHGAQCLISTYNNTFIRPNGVTGKGVAERYNIPRCSLGHNAERYPNFTIADLKAQIDQCAAAHGWLLITTHVNEWGSSTQGDDRLREVIQYALGKGCVFKTFAEAFEDRAALFHLNELL